MESGVGGKKYNIIKSMYTNNKCAVKIGLSPTLFNTYIKELERTLEQPAAPGLTLLESEVKCLLFADDLVLLAPTKEGLQQHLNLLHRF